MPKPWGKKIRKVRPFPGTLQRRELIKREFTKLIEGNQYQSACKSKTEQSP